MLAYRLASKPCSEATNIDYPLSSGAVFGLPRMDCSRVMGGRFGGEVGRFLLVLNEKNQDIKKFKLVDISINGNTVHLMLMRL